MLWLLACALPPVVDSASAPSDDPPAIATVSVKCDADDAKWSFNITTERWTGGGALYLSVDGDYVEKHAIPSVEAEGDGSADRLELKLALADDFRDVAPNSTTAFNCGTPGLHGLMVVYARDGETRADCRSFGEAATDWDAWGYNSCAETVEIQEKT
jgi:hypothetical protein